jgi:hypothetical protein
VLRLIPALLVLVFGILASAPAQAAVVPMCSDDGRSIIAPPIMVPVRGLVLEAPRPCPEPESTLMRSMPRDPNGQPTTPSESPLRAMPISSPDLPAPCAVGRSRDDAAGSPGLELAGSIERPPRG